MIIVLTSNFDLGLVLSSKITTSKFQAKEIIASDGNDNDNKNVSNFGCIEIFDIGNTMTSLIIIINVHTAIYFVLG